MKKIYIFLQLTLACFAANAQVQFKIISGFGTSLYDINSGGKGVHGNGYYDFATNASSTTEDGVGETYAITDSGFVLGKIDDGTENYIPAIKKDGTWSVLAGFPAEYGYTLYDISENGKYVVGQTEWSVENGSWGFIYNTETASFKLLSSDAYEAGSAYSVNNEGIAVGWVDDLPTGTQRMAAYFKEDGTITLIKNSVGEASFINSNNEIVGTIGGLPFYFKIGDAFPRTLSIPEGQETGAFSSISNTGVMVGYVQAYVPEIFGFLRLPIIYHSSFGAQTKLLSDILGDHDIDTTDLDGNAYKISSDGKYIGGFRSGPAFMATGWAVFLDDVFSLSTQSATTEKLSVYPNPAKDVLNIKNAGKIESIEIYNVVGQKVVTVKAAETINVSGLSKGTYFLKITANGKTKNLKFIKN